jgi:hypothetical protein
VISLQIHEFKIFLDANLVNLFEYQISQLFESFKISDIENISAILNIDEKQSKRLVIKFNETISGSKIKEVICTPDSRILFNELLSILSEYTVTNLGKRMVLTLTPSLEQDMLSVKFQRFREIKLFFSTLKKEEIERILQTLSKAKIMKYELKDVFVLLIDSQETLSSIRDQFGDIIRLEAE